LYTADIFPMRNYFKSGNYKPESSGDIFKRIKVARRQQLQRFKKVNMSKSNQKRIFFNSQIGDILVERFCKFTPGCKEYIEEAQEWFGLNVRGYFKLLKLARTIADLEGSDLIRDKHLGEALQYRWFDFVYLKGIGKKDYEKKIIREERKKIIRLARRRLEDLASRRVCHEERNEEIKSWGL
jgi:putative component of membrane protein insertase Oxa1/YidC/SpoIIIJ protein YidD